MLSHTCVWFHLLFDYLGVLTLDQGDIVQQCHKRQVFYVKDKQNTVQLNHCLEVRSLLPSVLKCALLPLSQNS